MAYTVHGSRAQGIKKSIQEIKLVDEYQHRHRQEHWKVVKLRQKVPEIIYNGAVLMVLCLSGKHRRLPMRTSQVRFLEAYNFVFQILFIHRLIDSMMLIPKIYLTSNKITGWCSLVKEVINFKGRLCGVVPSHNLFAKTSWQCAEFVVRTILLKKSFAPLTLISLYFKLSIPVKSIKMIWSSSNFQRMLPEPITVDSVNGR